MSCACAYCFTKAGKQNKIKSKMANYREIDNDDIFEDDFDILEIIDFGFPRQIYQRSEHFDTLDELGFYRRFRLTKQTTLNLLALIEDDIEHLTDLNGSVSPINQLLVCLRFFATNGHLQSLADFAGVHFSTVSRIINRVSRAIARLYPRFIQLPQNEEQINQAKVSFYQIASFPKVIGAVDGTHIKIQSPGGDDGEIFRNRKMYFSVNVQAIGDADLNILNLVARWPGSAHDATIFNNSRVRAMFDAGRFPNCILLGDSGYPVRPYFLTPLANPQTRPEQLYNEAHIRTRNSIERLFGVWKRRFPILAYGLRIKIDTALTVIVAAGVLYNFSKRNNEGEAPPAEGIDQNHLQELIQMGQIPGNPNAQGHANRDIRNEFINTHFANL